MQAYLQAGVRCRCVCVVRVRASVKSDLNADVSGRPEAKKGEGFLSSTVLFCFKSYVRVSLRQHEDIVVSQEAKHAKHAKIREPREQERGWKARALSPQSGAVEGD